MILTFSFCVNPYWVNLSLGIFGSTLISLLGSIIAFHVEKKRMFNTINAIRLLYKCMESIKYCIFCSTFGESDIDSSDVIVLYPHPLKIEISSFYRIFNKANDRQYGKNDISHPL